MVGLYAPPASGYEESAAGQGDALIGEGAVRTVLQYVHSNRFVEPLVVSAQRYRVASFLASLARRVVSRRAARRPSSEAAA